MILDIRTGTWTKTEPIPTPRYAHACLLTEVNGVAGVMVTGKNDHVIRNKFNFLGTKYLSNIKVTIYNERYFSAGFLQ